MVGVKGSLRLSSHEYDVHVVAFLSNYITKGSTKLATPPLEIIYQICKFRKIRFHCVVGVVFK